MKSRILSFNVGAETMKKQIWIPALIILGFFLSLPVAGIIFLGWLQAGERPQADIVQSYISFLAGEKVPFLAMMTMGSAVLTGVSNFSWLHSRVKTDFYHSLPIRREKLFINQVILDFAYYVVPYLLNLLLAYAVGAVYGVLRGQAVRESLESFLFQLLFYLLIYFVVVLAMLLSGKLLVGVLGAVVLLFYGPMMDMVLRGVASTFFSTYSNQGLFFSSFLESLSPIIKYAQMCGTPSLSPKALGVCILAAAALGLLCFFLYKKRPSESAGRAVAFCRIGKVCQYMIELLVILAFGILFCNVTARGNTGWTIFGILLGGVLSHGIMEMIQEGDIRQVMAHKWLFSAAVATSLAVFGACYWDVFQYDEFLPKQEDLKAVRIKQDDSYESGGVNGYRGANTNEEKREAMEQLAAEPAVYETLQQILAHRLEQVENLDGQVRFRGARGKAVEEVENSRYIQVEYVLSSGRSVYREYLTDYDQLRSQLLALYNSEAYKKTVYPLVTMTEDEMKNAISGGDITSIDAEIFSLPGNDEARVELLKTYRAELMQINQSTLENEWPIGSMNLTPNWEYQDESRQPMTGDVWSVISNQSYYIYPSFTRTLALLKDRGIELPDSFRPGSVESITVYSDDAGDDGKVIRDKEEIRKLLPDLRSREVENGMATESGEFAVVRVKRDGYSEDISCTLKSSIEEDTEE